LRSVSAAQTLCWPRTNKYDDQTIKHTSLRHGSSLPEAAFRRLGTTWQVFARRRIRRISDSLGYLQQQQIVKPPADSRARLPTLTDALDVAAVFDHVGSDVVVFDAWGFRVDAREAVGVAMPCETQEETVVRRNEKTLI